MRLQRITTNYPAYLQQFYAKHPDLISQSYSIQHAALMWDAYGWADFWSIALAKLGYETNEIISNAETLQKTWARENDERFSNENWLFDITTAQTKAFKPEILFVNDYATYSASYVNHLRAECPSIRFVLGWCGAPYTDSTVFGAWDLILTSVPELIEDFLAQGHRCVHINHAFDPRILERIQETRIDVDFSFIGTVAKKNSFHNSREQLLVQLLASTPLKIWTDVYQPSWQTRSSVLIRQWAFDAVGTARRAGVSEGVLKTLPLTGKAVHWTARPSLPPLIDQRIVSRAKPPLFGLDMFQQLRRSRVSLNTHIDLSSSYASNMRLYEATGVGSCLLTDAKSNLTELFEADSEIVVYENSEDCVEKVNYLLGHEEVRTSIAKAGQKRTLRDHSFDNRAIQMDDVIRKELASN